MKTSRPLRPFLWLAVLSLLFIADAVSAENGAGPSFATPTIAVYQPGGVQSGDVTILYVIADAESDPVSLEVEYSTNDGLIWLPASVTGVITDIGSGDYEGSLVWNSGTDLTNQEIDNVLLRITPSDAMGQGIADFTLIDLDNQSPSSMSAEGIAGQSTVAFWFNEPVTESTVLDPSNITLSNGLSVESIYVNDTWTTKTSMPTARFLAMSGVIAGKLYVAGGYDWSSYHLDMLEVYDPATDSWTTKASMPTARNCASAGVIDGKFYVAGGWLPSGFGDILEVYDPATDSWTTKASMPTARDEAMSGVIDGKLYVAGGYDGNYLDILEIYDPSTDSWTTGTPMPTARHFGVSGVLDGKLYVAGGYNGSDLSILEVYDPATDSWTTKAPMPTARYTPMAGIIDGKFYVAGGFNGPFGEWSNESYYLNTLEVYDPATDSWTAGAPMPTARDDAVTGTIDGKLYVVGGYDGSDPILSTLEVYDPQYRFIATLADGQTLPAGESVTVGISNVSDYYSNMAAGLFKASFETAASILTVTQTGDSGPGSLREAMLDANASPGKDLIKFDIQGTGPFTIQPAGPLPDITDPVIIDGYSQPGASPSSYGPGRGSNAVLMIEIDGSNAGPGVNGLTVLADSTTVKGLAINRFGGSGIYLATGGGSLVAGNYIGTDVGGMQDLGNADSGVEIFESSNNVIGGTKSAYHNLISGNNTTGVSISGPGSTGNLLQGNLIGTDATGGAPLANTSDYYHGAIQLNDAPGNTIGGSPPEARNVISGNYSFGILVTGTSAIGNVIQGNYVGTNVAGDAALPNATGISIRSSNNTIGGAASGEGNLISGNSTIGLSVYTQDATGNQVLGNLVGTDASGTSSIANNKGIVIGSSSNNVIGGLAAGERNTISGNSEVGIAVAAVVNSQDATGNQIIGNYIGTNKSGASDIGNGAAGIQLAPASPIETVPLVGGVIGGTVDLRNGGADLQFGSTEAAVEADIKGNVIGGTEPGSGNLIAYNGGAGILCWGDGSIGNAIFGNSIFANSALAIDLATSSSGDDATPNDTGDGDSGFNNLQNFPVLDSANYGPESITVTGFLNSSAEAAFTIQFYASSTADPSGYGEGETFLGSSVVTTNGAGDAAFTVSLEIKDTTKEFISATATAPDSSSSEFSLAIQASVLKVTNTADSGPGSFRAAIETANSGAEGTIEFDIPDTDPGYDDGTGTWTIRPTTPLPSIESPVTIDGFTQPGAIANTNPIGNGSNAVLKIVLDGSAQTGGTAILHLSSGGSVIRGLVINGSPGAGIHIDGGSGNVIEGCYIGTDASGTTAVANIDNGIRISGSAGNMIGGETPAARNVISGNGDIGIEILLEGADLNKVKGNYIGVDATGLTALGNGSHGVLIGDGADKSVVGGPSDAERNIISGNGGNTTGHGVSIFSSETDETSENIVVGNFIGTDADGSKPLPNNGDGIEVHESPGNKIGGSDPGTGNLISGNEANGVEIEGVNAYGNLVQGNLIGTNSTGTDTLDTAGTIYESGSNKGEGVHIVNAPENTIGGTSEAARNIISGNWLNGVRIDSTGATDNLVQGNYIGTDINGDGSIINGRGAPSHRNPPQAGVVLFEAPGNLIGGTVKGAGNVISGNLVRGIRIWGSGARGNNIQGNFIGTNAAGTGMVGPNNNTIGISLGFAVGNTIGGAAPGTGNLIGGNTSTGVSIFGAGADSNRVIGNGIGVDATGTAALGNNLIGVYVGYGTGNAVGGTAQGESNVISGNGTGLWISNNATGTLVLGNLIGTDPTGTRDLGNSRHGIVINEGTEGPPSSTIIGGTETTAGNIIAYNDSSGIWIDSGTGHTVRGNLIFSNGLMGISFTGEDAPTPNDEVELDDDTGPNNLQNYPVLTSVTYGPGSVTIVGSLTSTTNTDFAIDFYANAAVDESGYGEGQVYLGTYEGRTNSSGELSFEASFQAEGTEGVYVTATATDPDGNTSEFSSFASTPIYEVTTTADSGEGSLRQAVLDANDRDGTDTIVFNIPQSEGVYDQETESYSYPIVLQTALPELSTSIILDGSTQPDYSGMPVIILDGGGMQGDVNGLMLTGGNSNVRGLVINGFNSNGILIEGAGSNVVEGNFIGTDATGTQADGNGVGIRIVGSTGNRIGAAAWPNIIAGNANHGIYISGSASTDNSIEANFIGTNPNDQQDLANGGDGVRISDEGDGAPVDNSVGGYDTGNEGNIIAYNTGYGVAVLAGTGNSILSSDIYSNGEMGITLTGTGVPVPNDPADADSGVNNLQNTPVITFAQSYPHYVEGLLEGESNKSYRIEFFVSLASDPSGSGEGDYFLGATDVTTFDNGLASFTGSFQGPMSTSLVITATATDSDGNTSEFSAPYSLTSETSSYGHHYVLNTTLSGIPLHWDKGISTFSISESIPDEYSQAITNGYGTWDALGQLAYNQTAPVSSNQWGGNVDGINNNVWITSDWGETTGASDGTIALTRVRYNAKTGVMTDVDIAYNAEHHIWAAGAQVGSNTLDVQNVVTHEVGHFSGLGDIYESGDPGYVSSMGSGNTEQTMYGLIKIEETKKKDLGFGDELGVEAIYGFLNKTGIDLMLVVDGSDRYASPTEGYYAFEEAQQSAAELVDKLRVGDRIGIVQLNEGTPIDILPITQITESESKRESIKSDIMNMTPTGGMVIPLGAAVQRAQNQLELVSGTYTSSQAMILFSTGEETAGPYVVPDVMPDLVLTDTEVYTIGFADNVDGGALLSQLSDETGGKYYMAIDAAEIGDKVGRIWEHLIGWQALYQETLTTDTLEGVAYPGVAWEGGVSIRWQGGIDIRWQGADGIRWQGGTDIRWQGGVDIRWQGADGIRWQGGDGIRWQGGTDIRWQGAIIDGGITEIEPGVRWMGSDLDLTIQDPTGRLITPEVAASDDMIEYVSGDTYEYYRIKNPMPGEWTPWIYGADLPEVPEPFTVYMAVHTDLTMDVVFDKEQYEVGENMLMSVNLNEGGGAQGGIDIAGGQAITDASVYALINRPGSQEPEGIELTHVGNGEYTAIFTATEETGDYRFFFGAERATPDGNSLEFFRWAEHSVHVSVSHGSGLAPIRSSIMLADDSAFKPPASERKAAFSNKLDAVENQLRACAYNGAIQKLEKDILSKMDGVNGGNPKDDWIIDYQLQNVLYNLITAFIVDLQEAGASSSEPEKLIEEEQTPERFELSQNFPNPFNIETQIRYSLPEARRVTLRIYDIRGRVVRTLMDAEQSAGTYTIRWDGRNSDGFVVSSGIYIYYLKAGRDAAAMKMTIIK